jgi:hypothetical protein
MKQAEIKHKKIIFNNWPVQALNRKFSIQKLKIKEI